MTYTTQPTGTLTAVTRFIGPYRFLSNFYLCAVTGPGDLVYPSVEHAYQASKSPDVQDWARIAAMANPGDAKRYGKHLNRDEENQLNTMLGLLRQKFAVGSQLATLLLNTGDALLQEGNVWGDRYWGVYCGEGQNHLGRLLMQVRDELKAAATQP